MGSRATASSRPHQVWVGDSTYPPLVGERWCHLATWRDACSRRVVGRSTLKTELLPHGSAFPGLEEARLEVAYYLDTYFHLDCRHSALSYRSPTSLKPTCFNTCLSSLSAPTKPPRLARYRWPTVFLLL